MSAASSPVQRQNPGRPSTTRVGQLAISSPGTLWWSGVESCVLVTYAWMFRGALCRSCRRFMLAPLARSTYSEREMLPADVGRAEL
jgi:hypothetical protein